MSSTSDIFAGDGSVFSSNLTATLSNKNLDNVIQVRSLLEQQVLPYFSQMLFTTLMMNTSYNSTKYITNDMENKAKDAREKETKARNSIGKARYNYFQKKYTISYNKFISGVLQGAILTVAICAVLAGLHLNGMLSSTIVAVLVSCIVLVYMIILAILLKNNSNRRKDDWNKFYFAPFTPSS